MFLSLHIVFLLNENIRWLEEFIVYYINLGVEHFYLYNNEGSDGGDGSKTHNKYNFPISTTSSKEDVEKFEQILLKYEKYITHVLWQPKNIEGKIIYGQNEAIEHFISKYGEKNEWVAFLDTDEFIFSEKNINLIEFLKSLDKNVSNVKLIQKKFLSRFLSNERFITQEFSCINNLKIGLEWAPKNIIRCKDFLSLTNIHDINTKNKTIVPYTEILRFNHYNVSDVLTKWMKDFYKFPVEISINGKDDGMKRYKDIFDKI
jgi:hypothetical protein